MSAPFCSDLSLVLHFMFVIHKSTPFSNYFTLILNIKSKSRLKFPFEIRDVSEFKFSDHILNIYQVLWALNFVVSTLC